MPNRAPASNAPTNARAFGVRYVRASKQWLTRSREEGRFASRLAFIQWFAAQLRHPYTESPVLSAYVEALPSADVLKALNAREVPSGGRLWLIRPQDDGVFQFTQTIEGLVLVSDAQIYLDLLQTGQRGPDAADTLRRWEGFRR